MGRRKTKVNSLQSGKNIWKVALYIRLSKEDGNEVSNSVKNQQERLMSYLSTFEEAYEIVGAYIDDGYTGTDTNRESFQRMMQHIREHKVNCVIVKDLSRLSRNVTDATYHLENLFIEHNVRFISLELPMLDSYKHPEQMNSILVPIQNVINDDFCRQTSIKIRGVFNTKRKNGEFIGAFAPYGYIKNSKDKHSFIIDEEAAQVIRDIYKWFVQDGISKGAITRKLNDLGIPNPSTYKKQNGMKFTNNVARKKATGTLWASKTVSDILQNQMYLGHMVQGKQRVKSYKVHTAIRTPKEEWFIVENTHEPIISQKVFDLAAKLHSKDTRTAEGKSEVSLFSGFVRCADCNGAMVRNSTGSKAKYAYYKCRTYREQSKEACSKHTIRTDVLENAVLNALKMQINMVSDMNVMIEEINQAPMVRNESDRLNTMLATREKELQKALSIKDSLFDDWKNGDISKADYNRQRERYDAQVQLLEESVQVIKREKMTLADGIKSENPFLETFLKHKTINALNRNMLVELVDTIYIHENGEVEIVFAFKDQYTISDFAI